MMKTRRTHANSERRARIIWELRRLGVPRKDIAEFLSVSISLISYHLAGRSKAAIRAGVSGNCQ